MKPFPRLACWPCTVAAFTAGGDPHPVPYPDTETLRLTCEVCGAEGKVINPADVDADCAPVFAGHAAWGGE